MRAEDEFVMADGVAVVSGECDPANAKTLERFLLDIEGTRLDVDLRGVTFMDSSALMALVRVKRARPEMRIVSKSDAVRRLFEITGLAEHFS